LITASFKEGGKIEDGKELTCLASSPKERGDQMRDTNGSVHPGFLRPSPLGKERKKKRIKGTVGEKEREEERYTPGLSIQWREGLDRLVSSSRCP